MGGSIIKKEKQQLLLSVEGLRKEFDGTPVLNDVSFELHKGEVLVVLGPSGCGKSTLLRCLNGLEQTQGGSITLNEIGADNVSSFKEYTKRQQDHLISVREHKPVNKNDLAKSHTDWRKVRERIGMVFQNYELFPHLTVLDNILLGPLKVQRRSKEEATAQAYQLLERVGLSDRAGSYPRQLSGGQKQRIAIVRALCMNPEIMLFDEVTASLDPEMVREVLDVLIGLVRGGMTMIIVTHEMAFAKAVADRILFMDHGVILESTAPDRFFTAPTTSRAQQFLNIFRYENLEGDG